VGENSGVKKPNTGRCFERTNPALKEQKALPEFSGKALK
jgi:hypothetical protein